MTKSPRKIVPDVGIELGGRLHAKRTRFRSSYRARLSLLKLTKMTRGRNEAGKKRLILLGQIDLSSDDKAETTRWK